MLHVVQVRAGKQASGAIGHNTAVQPVLMLGGRAHACVDPLQNFSTITFQALTASSNARRCVRPVLSPSSRALAIFIVSHEDALGECIPAARVKARRLLFMFYSGVTYGDEQRAYPGKPGRMTVRKPGVWRAMASR